MAYPTRRKFTTADRDPGHAGMYSGGRPVAYMPSSQTIGVIGDPRAGTSQGLSDVATGYQQRYDKAYGANEQRYQDILGGYGDLRSRVMGALGSRSMQGERDITRRWDEEIASGRQDMVSRGLSGTTMLDTMRTGFEGEKTAALNRHRDEGLDRALGYDVGLTGNRLGFMERREDEYPNASALAQIAQMIGQARGQMDPGLLDLLKAMISGGGGSAGAGTVAPSRPR